MTEPKKGNVEPYDDYRAHLLDKHGGDLGQALREACWTVCMLDENAERSQDERNARQAKAESWGYLRKGNAYAVSRLPRPPVTPLDVSSEDSPHG